MFRSAQEKIKKPTLTIAGILATGGLMATSTTYALTFSQDVGVSFTFNSLLQVTLSSSNLAIPDLTPGTASDSNVITVNVKTNAANGYTLNATVGNNTTYNTRDMIHTNSNITNKFASVAFGSSVVSNTNLSDNTWAYSYRDTRIEGSTWTSYSGLPLYNDEANIATLKTATGPVSSSDGDDIEFKIAARASSDQPSGEYGNVINFTAVATPLPKTLEMAYADAGKTKLNGYYKLQDMNSNICAAAEVLDEGSQMQAIDIRDNKVYWITKLQDGHCWMTQNLDHDIVTTPGYYTHDNTDLGYGTSTITSWTPVRATIDASTDAGTAGSITGWTNSDFAPYSVNPGDWYWNNMPFYDSDLCSPNCNYITKTSITYQTYFSTTPYSSNGTHGHVGNYYNWSAAVAMNDTSGYTTPTYADISINPQTSICPAGWRLPTITYEGNVEGSTDEFDRLNGLYNNHSYDTSEALESAPLYFVRAGEIYSKSLSLAGEMGRYYSSTVSSFSGTYYDAYIMNFMSSFADAGSPDGRSQGLSLRCVAR